MWIDNALMLAPLFVWVGLMGGGSYVNVMHNLLEHPTLEQSEKEGALVMSLMLNDTGVLFAATFS